jgi:YVTN family beta-propeller protein
MRYCRLAGLLFACAVILFLATSCSGPDGASDSPDTGSVMFSIQWPDEEGDLIPDEWNTTISQDASSDTGILSVVEKIEVGGEPQDLAITANGEYVYVTNNDTTDVSVIRTSDNTIFKTIPVEIAPWSIAITPDYSYVYVANHGSDTVSVIDYFHDEVIGTFTVGDGPSCVTIKPDGSYVYVSSEIDNTVSVIRTSDNTVLETIPVGDRPWRMAMSSPNGSYLYVTNLNSDNISVIQTSDNTILKIIPTGDGPWSVAITTDHTYVYVTNSISDTVSVIDYSTDEVIKTISVGNGPAGVAISPDGRFVYVTNFFSNDVSVIQTSDNTVLKTISDVGERPLALAITPDGDFAYVVNSLENTVSVLKTTSEIPVATITSPSNNSTFESGDTITFSGTGIDPQDGTLTAGSLVWISSRDGQIGTGTAFSASNLTVGSHAITLTVTDSDGYTEIKSVNIMIETFTLSNKCNARGVDKVMIVLFPDGDYSEESAIDYRMFDCIDGQGTIDKLTPESGITVSVSGLNADQEVIYLGYKSGLKINAGSNDIGIIKVKRVQ